MKSSQDTSHLPVASKDPFDSHDDAIQHLDLSAVKELDSSSSQYMHLLLRRNALTSELSHVGLYPPLILDRARVYEALGYADLAAADAFVVYTLCEIIRSDEWVSDLEPVDVSGEPWPLAGNDEDNMELLCQSLALLCRSLVRLGATEDAREKFEELRERLLEVKDTTNLREADALQQAKAFLEQDEIVVWKQGEIWQVLQGPRHKFGWARREIYPWNEHEPNRNATKSLSELNSLLSNIAPQLEAKVTILPALNDDGSSAEGIWHQLGLFAAKDLPVGSNVLNEKSLLTAIRPLDDALCDACGVDLESTFRELMRQCPGEGCDTTFCSLDCAARAATEYHMPNVDNDDAGDNDEASDIDPDYPPPHAPFCGNAALQEIGRTSSTTTPEWDLYFLLLTRTVQTSITQNIAPLSLPSTKYLWGDFNPAPPHISPTPTITNPKRTLPWSLHHNLTLPLQYFETLMHSRPDMMPYSPTWLAHHDWWMQSTLLAKFRGVANAQQSTFDGKPEIAAVHPMWCLANHSCAPNVKWEPTGTRVFTVRTGEEVVARVYGNEWEGIKKGDEIWSHYTDVRLPVRERRERLMEVLGGNCRCERCLIEEKDPFQVK